MKFRIKPADKFIWNLKELVDFLIQHQHQHIVIENGTEGCCSKTIGLYDWLDKFEFASVTIETGNVLETHNFYNIKHILPWKFLKVSRSIEQPLQTWNQKSIFGTVFGRPIWHRLGIASYLLSQHPNFSAVGCLVDPANNDQRELTELTELYQHHPASVVNFGNIIDQLPARHIDIDEYTPGSTPTDGFVKQTERIYQNFLIDIVAETYTTGTCFFITEKTVRPMLLKKPMIVMGSRDYLDYLHQMGFQTFNNFWSENYDGFADGNRYIKILELIDSLAKLSVQELDDMYLNMQTVLDHNYQLLMNQAYKREITYITQ
jgi:hypothetical protein